MNGCAVCFDRDEQVAARHGDRDIFSAYQAFLRECRNYRAAARAAGEGKVLDPTLKCHGFDVVFADEIYKTHIRTLGKGRGEAEIFAETKKLVVRDLVPIVHDDNGVRYPGVAQFNVRASVSLGRALKVNYARII